MKELRFKSEKVYRSGFAATLTAKNLPEDCKYSSVKIYLGRTTKNYYTFGYEDDNCTISTYKGKFKSLEEAVSHLNKVIFS